MMVSSETQYKEVISLYKFHLEQLIKLGVIIFAITGAIISFFYLYNQQIPPYGFTVLLFPIILNVGFFLILDGSHDAVDTLQEQIKEVSENANHNYYPSFNALGELMSLFSIMAKIIFFGLVILVAFEAYIFFRG